MRADEVGVLRAGGGRPYAAQGLGGGQTQGLAAGQRRGGQATLSSSTAVVWDAESASLVVVQSTSCRGRHRSRKRSREEAERGGKRWEVFW